MRAGITGAYLRDPQESAGVGAGRAPRAAGVRMDTVAQDMGAEHGRAPHPEQGLEGRHAGGGGIWCPASCEASATTVSSQCLLPVIAPAEPGMARYPASSRPTHVTVKRRGPIIEGSTPMAPNQPAGG